MKLDASLAWEDVRQILIHLRDRGVRRVSLAVRSIGNWNVLPNETPLLVLKEQSSAPLFEPEYRYSGKTVIHVARWVPPPPPLPRKPPPCEGWDFDEFYRASNILASDTGPPAVALDFMGKWSGFGYQTLMENIVAAAAAGAREIHLPAEGR